ncbi:MAG: Ni/Fe-hydrogenase, b-type cytochrome subunit [Acetobacter sp.]|nr:Ni/Fe-hydrogenase, b-type cytochrome subunit [Acetobacter sp.]
MSVTQSNVLRDEDLKETHLQGLSARTLHARRLMTVYVYEAPVRLWHWVSALCILVLCITGYLIASPLPSLSGSPSEHYQMGWIRYLHFAAAWIFAIAFLGRVIWAFMGNVYAREMFYIPFWRVSYWKGLIDTILVYAFIRSRGKKFVGHNPLAVTAIFFCFTLTSIFMIFTGFALYSEGTGMDSWEAKLFGWVIPLLGGHLSTHFLHHWGMWVIILFVMIHVYTVVLEDIASRQSLISAMTNGYRFFKDDQPK